MSNDNRATFGSDCDEADTGWSNLAASAGHAVVLLERDHTSIAVGVLDAVADEAASPQPCARLRIDSPII